MSAAAPSRQRFMVYAPDKTEEGTFDRRLSVRQAHLEAAKIRIASGFTRMGAFWYILINPLTFRGIA